MKKNIKIKTRNNFSDNRGLLWTSWEKKDFNNIKFNHDKFSISKKKTY